MYYVFILGPAGSGKSYLTSAFVEWLKDHEMDAISVNLDPAAEWLPYAPDVDIRDYITVTEVMRKFNLGPNGGLIMAVDLIVNYISKIKDEIEEYRPNYVIVDTPGQMEIFAFRASGPTIIASLASSSKSVTIFLIDSYLATRPGPLLSMFFLALSTALYHRIPQLTVLSKADILPSETIDRIRNWIENPELFVQELKHDIKALYSYIDVEYLIESFIRPLLSELIPVSAITNAGLDELYAAIQRILAGGEDYLTEEPSEKL